MSEAPSPEIARRNDPKGRYGVQSTVPDYILGITYEIWEERQVEKILDYYGGDVVVYGMDGITRGAAEMVDHTRATLESFPDRILVGDDVIWSGTTTRGFSSHRVYSPMTNLGASQFGEATGRQVRVLNIADCEIENGVITREWLLRDNLGLVRQLGFDPLPAAQSMAAKFDDELTHWLRSEHDRVRASAPTDSPDDDIAALASRVLSACWLSGDTDSLAKAYAPYCVLWRAPTRVFSGRRATLDHYAEWRRAIPDARLSVDNVCSQPYGANGHHIAARWTLSGTHEGPFSGLEATGRQLVVLGASHWRIVGGRVVSEWTVFDELALMAQALGSLW